MNEYADMELRTLGEILAMLIVFGAVSEYALYVRLEHEKANLCDNWRSADVSAKS